MMNTSILVSDIVLQHKPQQFLGHCGFSQGFCFFSMSLTYVILSYLEQRKKAAGKQLPCGQFTIDLLAFPLKFHLRTWSQL